MMAGRIPSPIDAAICGPRSTTMTLMSASSPSAARRRAGISVAVSMPVKPPPATTTVLRAVLAGRFFSELMWASSRVAVSI
ncbi:hypothetical protein D3C86_1882110 [compost metagenome]